jgi:hypothetical protein
MIALMLLLARLRSKFFLSNFIYVLNVYEAGWRDPNLDSVVRISQGSNSYYRFASPRVENIVTKKHWKIVIFVSNLFSGYYWICCLSWSQKAKSGHFAMWPYRSLLTAAR